MHIFLAREIVEKHKRDESSVGDVCAPLWKKMLHLNIPAKVRVFAWRLCMKAIPSMLNMSNRGIQVDPTCPICCGEPESTEHAIIYSEAAKRVWSKWDECPLCLNESNKEIVDLALCLLERGTQRDMEIFFGVAWMIWYNRNQIVYEGNGVSEDHIWETAIQMIKEFKGTRSWDINIPKRNEKAWTPPPVGFFKINVDGAVPSVNGHSGMGVIIRD